MGKGAEPRDGDIRAGVSTHTPMFTLDVPLWFSEIFSFNQFDPESDPEGESPEETQTLWLQQEVSEWLVCLNMLLSGLQYVCRVGQSGMRHPL